MLQFYFLKKIFSQRLSWQKKTVGYMDDDNGACLMFQWSTYPTVLCGVGQLIRRDNEGWIWGGGGQLRYILRSH